MAPPPRARGQRSLPLGAIYLAPQKSTPPNTNPCYPVPPRCSPHPVRFGIWRRREGSRASRCGGMAPLGRRRGLAAAAIVLVQVSAFALFLRFNGHYGRARGCWVALRGGGGCHRRPLVGQGFSSGVLVIIVDCVARTCSSGC